MADIPTKVAAAVNAIKTSIDGMMSSLVLGLNQVIDTKIEFRDGQVGLMCR